MTYKNEEQILKIIKFTPPLFIISMSILLTIFLYLETKLTFQNEKKQIEDAYIERNKVLIKNQVTRVYDYIQREYKTTEERLKESIKGRVHEAHAIAMRIYRENQDKSKAEIKKMIQDALVDIRFNNGRGYFFIYNFDYECILLPVARHLEGKSFYNFKEGQGRYLTREIVAQVRKENEGFLKWHYHKPQDMKNQYPKIGFNKHFEPFDWFIGTGEYIDEFEEDIKTRVLDHISSLRYQNNGYIFVFHRNGTYLSYIKKEDIGKNIIDVAASYNTEKVFNAIKHITEYKGEGFLTYTHKDKPFTIIPAEKMSFVKGLDSWQWIIGTGFYIDDVASEVMKAKENIHAKFTSNITNLIIISIFLTLGLLLISIYISRILEKKFKSYKKEIKNHLEQNKIQHDMMAQQSKMAAMGEMIGNIAHQWRQPLSAITTAATGVKFQKNSNILTDQDLEMSLDCINNSAQFLSKTIDDFRNFFKSEKEKSTFDIHNTIDTTFQLMEAQFKNNGIQIIKKIQNIQVYNLENELIQVILNVINNARDQLISQQELHEKVIFIDAIQDNDQLIITIKDNGGGFDENIIDRVFEPYFTTKHKSQGTGIGLYMTEEIITKHMQGSITARNEEITHNGITYNCACIEIILPLMD